jgi:PAS domain S-box-containing protein
VPFSPEAQLARRDRIFAGVARVAEILRTTPKWEDGINQVLAVLGEATGVSRVYIFHCWNEVPGRPIARQLYEWAAPGVEPQIDVPELQHIDMIADGYGRWISELSAGRGLSGDVEEFPASEQPLLQMQSILSMVLEPLFAGERWWGLIGFDACDSRKTWSKAETDALRIAAESLGGAMHNQALAHEMRRRVDLLTETVIELDEHCRIRFVNPAWRALVGLEPADVIGRPLTDFVQPEYRLAVEARHRIAGRESDTRIEVRLQRPDGEERWATLAMEAMPEGGVVCAAHDFTAWRERADALAAAQARSDFLAKMSHEIRTPLNAILGLTYLAEQGAAPADHLQKIESATRTMLATVNDILDFSKIEAKAMVLENAPFSLRSLLHDLDAVIAPLAARASLEWAMDVDLAVPDMLLGDAHRLEQILMNLCSNAVKFTEKGSVALRVALESGTGKSVTLRFQVKDTGIGMDAEQTSRIFAPFQQAENSTARRFGGSGLGLTISRYLAEAMHGEITVRSALSMGSTFTTRVELEVAAGSSAVAAAPKVESPTAEPPKVMAAADKPLEGIRVLVAEDHALNQVVIRHLLQRFGATPIIAEDGQKALEAFQTQGPFDLVLMDVQMPVMDGLEATHRLRELPGGEDTWIIAITANVTPEDRARCFEAGMDDFIPKPIEAAEFAALLGARVGVSRLGNARA